MEAFLDLFYEPPTDADYIRKFLTGEKKRENTDQSSTHDQLKDLYFVALKIGKYDAAEFLNKMLVNDEKKMNFH